MPSIDLRFRNKTSETHGVAVFQKNVRGSALFVLRNVAPNEARDFSYELHPDDTTIHIATLRDLHDTALATELPIANATSAEIVMSGEEPYTFELARAAAPKRIIAVVGATGAQGGGLVRAILSDPSGGFTARAITRDVDTDKAKELAALGAEVVAADVDDPDSLRRAFEGAYGAYCVTFFWNHFSPEKELAHARAMATAARDAGVEHVIWSTLEDTRTLVPLSDDRMPTLMEKYKVPHFDAKGEADAIFTELGVPATFLLTSFYWDNFIGFGMGPVRGEDGRLSIALPMGESKLPGIAAEDIGRSAYGIFKRGKETIGKHIGIAGEHLSGSELAAAFANAIGEDVQYAALEPDVYRSLGFPGAEDLGNMFQFKRDFEEKYRGARNVDATRELNPTLRTFAQWLEENKARLAKV
jgi:uncharacterized protein YbjT (DUF2867 family)